METVLVFVTIFVAIWYFRRIYKKSEARAKKAEARRLAACEEVVRSYANYLGYIARSVVSREELEKIIDSGASADYLGDFISSRILEVDGLILGDQQIGESTIPVILPDKYRDKHIYIVGKSGYGKTNFLRHLIFQDLAAGNGLGILAPEYEMLNDEILPFIPNERIQDVIYFNPADIERPVVLNPLHLDEGEDIDLHVDEVFTILERVVGEGGPRMDEILRHSLYALIEKPNSTFLDIEPLLDRQDSSFRNSIIETTADDQTRHFFQQTYPQLPKDSHFPIINRIGRLIRAKYVRNCLCPPRNTTLTQQEIAKRLLNIRQAMDQGKILLFNLSDGILGQAASQLIGELIVSKFQTATMSRADTSKQYRKPFYLYLDEFQNFCGVASQSYEKILSRARKYKLGMILAHQQTGQLTPELLREIFGNVSTLVSFQVSQPDAVRLSKEFLSQYDFEIESVPSEKFLQLNVGQAYCRIGKSAFQLYVPQVNDRPDRRKAEQVISESREQYGIPRIMKSAKGVSGKDKQYNDLLTELDPEEVFD